MKQAYSYLAWISAFFVAGPLMAAEPEKTPAKNASTELVQVFDNHAKELWKELNERFSARFAKEGKEAIQVRSSGAGWSVQLQAILDKKIDADVATLGVGTDVDALRRAGLVAEGWEYRVPHRAVLYTSVIVFLVPAGNPRKIKDWGDVAREDVTVLLTNPATSRTGRHGFLAAWGSVSQRGGSPEDARAFVTKVFKKAVLPKPRTDGAPAEAFLPRQEGDVLLAWEKEAIDAVKASGGKFEVVYPSVSIRGEDQVTVVDKNVDRKGTRAAAEAYIKFLFSAEAQEIIAKHHLRPVRPVARPEGEAHPRVELFTLRDLFRDPIEGQERLFGKDGVFEQIRTVKQ